MANDLLRVRICIACNGQFSDEPCEPSECGILRIIENLDPESLRPKGRWISIEAKPHLIYECSLCKSTWGYGAMLHMSYCPNCGANMRGVGQ